MSPSPRRYLTVGLASAVVAVIAARTADAQGVNQPRPTVVAAKPFVFPAVVRRTLSNGLQLVIIERHDLPLVVVRTVFAGGPNAGVALADPVGKEGAFNLFRQMVNEGTPARTVDSLATRFAVMGSAVNDSGFITTPANVDSSLAILRDLLWKPALPAAALDRFRATRVRTAQLGRADGNQISIRTIASVLYAPGHPFTRIETEPSLTAITRDDIVALHSAWVRPPNLTLVIVGDVFPDAFTARAERILGAWPRGTGPTAESLRLPAGPFGRAPTAIYLAEGGAGPTSFIRIAGVVPPRDSRDVPALDVANAIYGSLSGGRLFRELRGRLGLAYGSSSAFAWRPLPSPSMLSATLSAIATPSADSAIAGVMRELRGIAAEKPPTLEEFEFGKTNRIASMPLQFETQQALAARLVELLYQNVPLDFFTRYQEGLSRVTMDDVRAAAKAHIDPGHTAIVVVGPVAVLEPKLRAANIAPVYVVDAMGNRIR
jgi:zinc protease